MISHARLDNLAQQVYYYAILEWKLKNQSDTDMHYAKILSQLGCKPQRISKAAPEYRTYKKVFFQFLVCVIEKLGSLAKVERSNQSVKSYDLCNTR